MKIPDLLEVGIENEIQGIKITELKELAQNLSNRYMNEKRAGQTLLSKEKEALAYSIMRMPATFCAVTTALRHTLTIAENVEIETVLDIGAGTGAATWAITELVNPKEIMCLEREEAMRKVGQALMKHNAEMQNIKWINEDRTSANSIKGADLIVTSYMINELKPEERKNVIQKLLNLDSKIVEPGYVRTLKQCLFIDKSGKMQEMELVVSFVNKFIDDNLKMEEKSSNIYYTLNDLEEALEFALISEGMLKNSRVYDLANVLLVRVHNLANSHDGIFFSYPEYITRENYIDKLLRIYIMIFLQLRDRIILVDIRQYMIGGNREIGINAVQGGQHYSWVMNLKRLSSW